MVKAGAPVDEFIEQLLPTSNPVTSSSTAATRSTRNDPPDAVRREQRQALHRHRRLGRRGRRLKGPSIMPGGSPPRGGRETGLPGHRRQGRGRLPCCDWVGENGAGHFVKMTHNGIEYGDMQLCCEAYQIMKDGLGMTRTK